MFFSFSAALLGKATGPGTLRNNYYTVSIDILHTSSLKEFVKELGNAAFATVYGSRNGSEDSDELCYQVYTLTSHFSFEKTHGTQNISPRILLLDNLMRYSSSKYRIFQSH